jgi:tRNA (cmo5U34)-methyltransferase
LARLRRYKWQVMASTRAPAETTAAGYFGDMVEAYDSLIRRAMPRYDEMLARLGEYLPDSAGRVLELGAGTGNLALALAARYPTAELVLVDAAPEMLAVTRARLERMEPGIGRRVRFYEARFEELVLEPASFDVMVSSISLHHVKDKGALYRALYAALAPGGRLCYSDQMAGGNERNNRLNWERWIGFCREPGHCSEAEVQSLLDHAAAHDHYTPLAEHMALLAAAGFVGIDCVWRNVMWGIVTADRPAG